MKTKICCRCKKEKFLNEFCKNKRFKNGLNNRCRECANKYNKQYIQNNPKKIWCRNTIDKHKQSGFKVMFTSKKLFLIITDVNICSICNCKLNWKYGRYGRGYNDNNPTLDRINNEKILTLNNIQVLCRRCNITKYNRTMEEFIDYCKMVYKKYEADNYKDYYDWVINIDDRFKEMY